MTTTKATHGVLDLCFIDVKNEEDIASYLVELEKEKEKKLEMETQQRMMETENSGDNTTGNTVPGPGGITVESPNTRKKNLKHSYKAIRIGNNNIDRIETIFCLSTHVNFENILWIDLSFNQLSKISKNLATTCPNLTTLYMQANLIQKIMDLKPLTDLKNLKKLVLFGNPVEESKHYRNMIFYLCPNLCELDYTPITSSQRKKNEIWQLVFRKQLHPDDYE